MSFSYDVKEELVRQVGAARHCQIAELAALISGCGEIGIQTNGNLVLIIRSENMLVVEKACILVKKAFRITAEVSVFGNGDWKKGRLYTMAVPAAGETGRILNAVKYLSSEGVVRELEMPVRRMLLNSTCCKRAFLRGAFLSTGSISDPEKYYHFEIVCANEEKALQLQEVIRSFNVDAKIVERKKSYVVYVKESEGISDLLNIMEAHNSMMNLENVRIYRGIKGDVNRTTNCDTANAKKMASASLQQVMDIEKIQKTIGFSSLPEPLRQMAQIRLEHPDVPLKELGQYLDPPVGKSGVNHRLRRLKEIAEKL